MASIPNVPPPRLRPAPLRDDWRHLLRRAWSIRWIVAAIVLSGLEAVCTLFTADPPIPLRWFATLEFLVTGGAFYARLVAQTNMKVPE